MMDTTTLYSSTKINKLIPYDSTPQSQMENWENVLSGLLLVWIPFFPSQSSFPSPVSSQFPSIILRLTSQRSLINTLVTDLQVTSDTWLARHSRHRVWVKDLHLYVFCDEYSRRAQVKKHGEFELNFVHGAGMFRASFLLLLSYVTFLFAFPLLFTQRIKDVLQWMKEEAK